MQIFTSSSDWFIFLFHHPQHRFILHMLNLVYKNRLEGENGEV